MKVYEPAPRVPDELVPLMDEHFLSVHERWQDVTRASLVRDMPGPVEVTGVGRAVVLDPDGERDESSTVVLALPHNQAWKPSMMARAAYMRDVVAPHNRVIVLPNNSAGDKYYSFTGDEGREIVGGNLHPFFDNRARLLEAIGVSGRVVLTGYSLGALTAAGIAHVAYDLDLKVVNSDEPPNRIRDPKQLQGDFVKSGGFTTQLKAVADAEVPALKRTLNIPRLATDYARFAATALTDPASKWLAAGMARHDYHDLVARVAQNHPQAAIKVGHVEGSVLSETDAGRQPDTEYAYQNPRVHVVTYTGEAARKHITGDNIAAHAVMVKHAIELAP